MHIPDGVLSGCGAGIGVLSLGAAAATVGTVLGLRRMDYQRVPQVALLSATFFVASCVRVPVGLTSEHLVLNGLIGLVLGWTAFPAILIALFLQAILFGFGGLTTLGINTLNMALPAVACYGLFRRAVHTRSDAIGLCAGFGAGVVGFTLSAVLLSLSLMAAGAEFKAPAVTLFALHLPAALAEGLVTASAVALLRKVRPELLNAPLLGVVRPEVSDA